MKTEQRNHNDPRVMLPIIRNPNEVAHPLATSSGAILEEELRRIHAHVDSLEQTIDSLAIKLMQLMHNNKGQDYPATDPGDELPDALRVARHAANKVQIIDFRVTSIIKALAL